MKSRAAGRIARLSVFLVCAMLMPPSRAATSDPGTWFIVSSSGRVGSADSTRWRYAVDAQARYTDIGSGTNQFMIRPALGYDLRPNLTAFAGYARFRSHTASGSTVTEHRYWQQAGWRVATLPRGNLAARLRLEERDLSNRPDLGIRLRAQLKYTRPAGARGSFVASLEPFYIVEDMGAGTRTGWDQNRVYLGYARKLSPRRTLEIGYQHQRVSLSGEDRVNHLLMLHWKMQR